MHGVARVAQRGNRISLHDVAWAPPPDLLRIKCKLLQEFSNKGGENTIKHCGTSAGIPPRCGEGLPQASGKCWDAAAGHGEGGEGARG